ncbi:YciI family protein [Imperialibacter roseus]|uniref:YciI family protein n=1 Tax=Imperialibacter roseus TaxID=1324217 RepID=A0ABZ0IW54_9BACT|nr:YciI family protein [Imperialibacter roseus]WOK08339.1 YciI family protein [Imperialibacter roseus]
MNEFLLLFRRDYQTSDVQPTPEQLQEHIKHWQKWYGELASKEVLAKPVQRLDLKGQLLSATGKAAEGPYVKDAESIGGYLIIKADTYQDAVKIAQDCPIFELGGNVEVRQGN